MVRALRREIHSGVSPDDADCIVLSNNAAVSWVVLRFPALSISQGVSNQLRTQMYVRAAGESQSQFIAPLPRKRQSRPEIASSIFRLSLLCWPSPTHRDLYVAQRS